MYVTKKLASASRPIQIRFSPDFSILHNPFLSLTQYGLDLHRSYLESCRIDLGQRVIEHFCRTDLIAGQELEAVIQLETPDGRFVRRLCENSPSFSGIMVWFLYSIRRLYLAQFIEGLDRQQTMLLPEHLDDYVDANTLSAPLMPLPTCWI